MQRLWRPIPFSTLAVAGMLLFVVLIHDPRFYRPYVFNPYVMGLAPLVIFISLIVFMRRQHSRLGFGWMLLCTLLAVAVPGYILLVALRWSAEGSFLSHRDTITLDGQLYQLGGRFVGRDDDYQHPPVDQDEYYEGWLYQCDAVGFLCDVVGTFPMRESSRMLTANHVIRVLNGDGESAFTFTP